MGAEHGGRMTDPIERRRGRPRLAPEDKAEPVTVHLPPSLHDVACVYALSQDVPVSAVIRKALRLFLSRARA